jgi:hypothetical protein
MFVCLFVCLLFVLLFIYLFADFSREHMNIKHSPPFFYKAHSQNCEKLLLALSRLSVCRSLHSSAWNNSAPTGQIFMKFDFSISENLFRKSQLHENLTRMTGISYEERIFMIISHPILLRMRNLSYKSCTDRTHILLSTTIFFKLCCLCWDHVEKYCRAGQVTEDIMVHVHHMLDT